MESNRMNYNPNRFNLNNLSGIFRSKLFWIIVGLIVLYLFGPVEFIESGNRGLRFTMGAIGNVELDEGINFKLPFFQKIRTVTIRPQELTFTVAIGEQAAISKDNQSIGATLTVFYRYKEGSLVRMWSQYGTDMIGNVLTKTSTESFKKAIGQYTIFDIAANQEKIRSMIKEMTVSDMSGYPVEVTELKVTNYDWSEAFEKQIEETMQRAQQVKQKEQELLITEQEAQKLVKQAEAEKTAKVTKAEGEKLSAQLLADAKALEGEGIRKYNDAVQKNMELEIKLRQLQIEQIKAERWNGQYVPTNNYGPIPVQTGGMQPSGH